ncbi:hypothetical protein LZ31DRAFT_337451 [Colletotrichum somersetense]|nr:hypothetical protein LZ31DRAFT_337451 [Colletotrichum somersetense]
MSVYVCVCVCVYVCSVRACVYGCGRGSDSEPALNPEGRTSGGHVIQHTVRVGPRREGERDERRRGCYLMGKAKGGSDRLTQRNGRSPQEDEMGWDGMGKDGRRGGQRVAAGLGMPHLVVFSTHCPQLHRFSWLDPSAKEVSQHSCTVPSSPTRAVAVAVAAWSRCEWQCSPLIDDDYGRPQQRNKV